MYVLAYWVVLVISTCPRSVKLQPQDTNCALTIRHEGRLRTFLVAVTNGLMGCAHICLRRAPRCVGLRMECASFSTSSKIWPRKFIDDRGMDLRGLKYWPSSEDAKPKTPLPIIPTVYRPNPIVNKRKKAHSPPKKMYRSSSNLNKRTYTLPPRKKSAVYRPNPIVNKRKKAFTPPKKMYRSSSNLNKRTYTLPPRKKSAVEHRKSNIGFTTGIPAKIKQPRKITRPTSCSDVKLNNGAAKDGHYDLYPASTKYQKINIYCYNMKGSPTEYLTLLHHSQSRNLTFSCGGGRGGFRGRRRKRSPGGFGGPGGPHHGPGGHHHGPGGPHHGGPGGPGGGGPGMLRCGRDRRQGQTRPPNVPQFIHTTEYQKLRIDLQNLKLHLTDSPFIKTFNVRQPVVGGPFGTWGAICSSRCGQTPPIEAKIVLYDTPFQFTDREPTFSSRMKPRNNCPLNGQEWFYMINGCGIAKMVSPVRLTYHLSGGRG